MGKPTRADSWQAAIVLARERGPNTQVAVSKAAEPCLPADLELRPSNFPWSIHKGARRVYRQDSPARHLQIREFRNHWTVELDRFNPHYDPLRHARGDVPAAAVLAYPVFAGAQTLRITGDLSAALIERQTSLVADGVRSVVSRLAP